ncbi:MAG TPA: hypothetical protein DCL41_02420, partial [Bdellovibrionales bacterium]|nr:hypothetical protein [Bdellovibrionales bacterium]
MKQPLVLKIYRDGQLINIQQFTTPQVVFGRGGDVQVALEDDSISPIHALLDDRGNQVVLSDLGSQTGTYLSGKRVLESEIKSGEEIRLGPFVVQFFIGVPRPAGIPQPMATDKEDLPAAPEVNEEPPELPEETAKLSLGEPAPEEEEVQAPSEPEEPPSIQEPSTPDEPEEIEEVTFVPPPPLSQDSVEGRPPEEKRGRVSGKTYAPDSFNSDPKEVVRPGKGSVVEIIVFWHERAIATYHFTRKGNIKIGGSESSDVFVPIMARGSTFTLVKLNRDQATICISPEMTGELVRFDDSIPIKQLARMNKLRDSGDHYELDLKQGEMIRVALDHGLISLIVRYKEATPKALAAPLLDLSTSELTGVVLSLVIGSILSLYMFVYAPQTLNPDEAMIEEPLRKAIVKFNPPKKKIVVAKDEPQQVPTEKKVVKVAEKSPISKAAKQERQTPTPSKEKAGKPGKAGEVAPSKKPSKSKEVGSARPGGSQKTAAKDGANAKSAKPDPMKTGLMSAFGSKGLQDKLDKAYSGSGELQGLADQATGTSGMADTRPGEGLGTKMKEGASGKGESIVGISGVGTKGRGTGTTGYGSGGIGKKGSVEIDVGGGGAGFTGSIDKEAIRRVIRDHLREI